MSDAFNPGAALRRTAELADLLEEHDIRVSECDPSIAVEHHRDGHVPVSLTIGVPLDADLGETPQVDEASQDLTTVGVDALPTAETTARNRLEDRVGHHHDADAAHGGDETTPVDTVTSEDEDADAADEDLEAMSASDTAKYIAEELDIDWSGGGSMHFSISEKRELLAALTAIDDSTIANHSTKTIGGAFATSLPVDIEDKSPFYFRADELTELATALRDGDVPVDAADNTEQDQEQGLDQGHQSGLQAVVEHLRELTGGGDAYLKSSAEIAEDLDVPAQQVAHVMGVLRDESDEFDVERSPDDEPGPTGWRFEAVGEQENLHELRKKVATATDGGATVESHSSNAGAQTNAPQCQNCGNHVTPDYVRVFTPEDIDQPRACPACPDKIRDGSDVRDARASRADARSVDDGADPNIAGDGVGE